MDVLTPVSYVVMAPKGITEAQAAWWDAALTKTLQTDEIRKDIEKNLWTVDLAGHKELPAQLDAQFERYQKRLTEMGLVK
jgi:putative tricarboxylic transport membrane protein